jgi:hypothetical protein
VYLPGVASNNLSIPSSTALNITGDIDLRAYVASDNWANGATFQEVISKWDTTANTRQYAFVVDTLGKLQLIFSIDGITGITTGTSSLAVPFTNGVANWIRATRAQAAGEIKFFTGTDGINWTQLGTTITGLSTSNFFTSSTSVMLGNNPTNSRMLIGKLYRAQIYSDITETTKVLDVDTSVITAGSATSFTAVTGQTVTINRSTSGRKTVAVTQPTWLFGTDDYMEVNNRYMAHSTSAENYVYLSGNSGNYMSVADNPPLDITGDLDIQVKVALDDWTPSGTNVLVGKWNDTGTDYAYRLAVTTSGAFQLNWYDTGLVTTVSVGSTITNTITDGTVKWVRATLDVNNNAGGNDVKFFTSDDGTTWTQFGATVTNAYIAAVRNSTSALEIGAQSSGTAGRSKGKFFRAIVKNGIDGTVVLDADASVITLPSQTTFVDSSSNAYTVTINKSGVGTFVSTGNYMYLPGIASNYASAPDSAALDITGDIDLRVKVALDDWTPAANTTLIAKYTTTGNQRSYRIYIGTAGQIVLQISTDGATPITLTNNTATGVSDGSTKWIRATRVASTGLCQFFTSDDGTTWTQLGSDVSGTSGNLFSGTAVMEVGSSTAGASEPARGKFFRAQVLNGIGGTVAFDANFENSITSLLQTSFTESSTNGATVTINRSGSTFRSAGVIDAGYLYPGATNTFSNSTTDFLDFGATNSLTMVIVNRQWATIGGGVPLMSKVTANSVSQPIGYYFTTNRFVLNSDGVNNAVTESLLQTSGVMSTLIGVRNTTADTMQKYINATAGTVATDTTTGTLQNNGTLLLRIADYEFIAAAVFRSALTAAQIRQISNYFANREVYL